MSIMFLQKLFKISIATSKPIWLNQRFICTSPVLNTFWERDEKGGYNTSLSPSAITRIREGFKELKKEIALWKKEIKEDFQSDPILTFRPGETDIVWKFQNEESLKPWVVTSDSDHNEGFSKCNFELNKYGKGLFSGTLCTRVPKDGKVYRSGYCNIKTMRARKSFKRDTYLDWTSYNMLVLNVRGDGRSYLLNVATKGIYDIIWNDVYHFVLYTRGGPYWQKAKIPFSKFALGSKGRIQDRQSALPLNRVSSFGITACDKINGSFSLEIDYIGLEYDPNHREEFAYEMYKAPKYIVGT